MSRLLDLPFDELSVPPSLRSTRFEFSYIEKAAHEVRTRMNLRKPIVGYKNIIGFFNELHAVLIPVLWGEKKNHENALHIYLPDSMTTWIYLNLDSGILDFKFWMAHELGHVKAPSLSGDDAEAFADAFAAELLFPYKTAYSYYKKLAGAGIGEAINKILSAAEEWTISPITVLDQINKAAVMNSEEILNINIYPASANFKKKFSTMSASLFYDASPSPPAGTYIRTAEEIFKTPFFTALRQYLIENDKAESFIQRIMKISMIDAKEIYKVLRARP